MHRLDAIHEEQGGVIENVHSFVILAQNKGVDVEDVVSLLRSVWPDQDN